MRALSFIPLILLALGLSACKREEPTARQVGREAYKATQDLKRGAKKAAQELRSAGKEIREGWSEAREKERAKRQSRPPDEPKREK